MEDLNFYSDNTFEKIAKRRKYYGIALILLCIIFVSTLTIGLIFLNRDNKVLVCILLCVIGIILFTAIAYLFLNYFLPYTRLKKHFTLIRKEIPIPIDNVIISKVSDHTITLSNNLQTYQIKVMNQNNEFKNYYVLAYFDKENLIVNKLCCINIASSFVVGVKYESK